MKLIANKLNAFQINLREEISSIFNEVWDSSDLLRDTATFPYGNSNEVEIRMLNKLEICANLLTGE